MSRTIKILVLATNPGETEHLRLDQEVKSIDQALQQSKFRDKFELDQQWAVRVSELQRLLLRFKPDIVHFSGHGSESSEIILEDDEGNSKPVPAQALSKLFSLFKDNIKCVVLNACYTEAQADAVAKHISCVVGMSRAIGDEAAISFSEAFYGALGDGRDIKTAFEFGCNQINLENLDEQDTPRLKAKNEIAEGLTLITDTGDEDRKLSTRDNEIFVVLGTLSLVILILTFGAVLLAINNKSSTEVLGLLPAAFLGVALIIALMLYRLARTFIFGGAVR